jgi:hypothetical protein
LWPPQIANFLDFYFHARQAQNNIKIARSPFLTTCQADSSETQLNSRFCPSVPNRRYRRFRWRLGCLQRIAESLAVAYRYGLRDYFAHGSDASEHVGNVAGKKPNMPVQLAHHGIRLKPDNVCHSAEQI